MINVPLEDDEQASFVTWLENNGLKFTAIPNSTYTKYMSQKIKNHRLGLRPGFPDLIVVIPRNRSKDGEGYFLCIEMKRIKGSSTSQDQYDWKDAINDLGVNNIQSYICKGEKEAKNVVSHYCKDLNNDIF